MPSTEDYEIVPDKDGTFSINISDTGGLPRTVTGFKSSREARVLDLSTNRAQRQFRGKTSR